MATNNENRINGGATLWARKTIDSEIFLSKPAQWFKVWFYIVNKANYKDTKGFSRGETFIRQKDICNKTGISRDALKKAFSWLRKEKMIGTTKSTTGTRIKVLNYNDYQSIENYRGTTKGTTINNKDIKKKKNNNLSYNCKNNCKKKDYVGGAFQKHKKVRVKHYNNVWLDMENSEWYIDDDIYETWLSKHPDIDIDIELQKMAVWLHDHKDVARRHELKRTYPFFCVDWFKRAENKINEKDKSVEEVRNKGADSFSEMLAEKFSMEDID